MSSIRLTEVNAAGCTHYQYPPPGEAAISPGVYHVVHSGRGYNVRYTDNESAAVTPLATDVPLQQVFAVIEDHKDCEHEVIWWEPADVAYASDGLASVTQDGVCASCKRAAHIANAPVVSRVAVKR